MGQQPKWKTILSGDDFIIDIDETGAYEPEAEVAQEIDERETKFHVYRFILERQKEVRKDNHLYLLPEGYTETWPHEIHQYEEWFVKHLSAVASSAGTTEEELRTALCSEDPKERFWAYRDIGGHFGYDNLDSYPLELTKKELDERWGG